jgi:hypothetical protein
MDTDDRHQQDHQQPEDSPPEYSRPEVEDLPMEDGPAVTAAGKSPPQDEPLAAEWRL